MALRLLNAQDVRALLPMDECIPLMRQAFRLVADGSTRQPIRTSLHTPQAEGLLSMMPGYTAEPAWLGIKVVSVFPGNFGTGFGSHQGVVLLFDSANGAPVAMLDGREVTAIRTAAATAAATDALARSDAHSLTVFGYGEQARTHLESLPLVRPFDKIQVWGRDPEKAGRFCAEMSAALGRYITAITDLEAAAGADVLCLATAASEPFLEGRWLRPGQHINVVGSSIPTTSEIDISTVTRSRVFVDFKDSALELAGDLRQALANGAITASHVLGDVGQVLTGRVAGRQADDDITLFKSLGMICEDLVSADHVLRKATRMNVGQLIPW